MSGELIRFDPRERMVRCGDRSVYLPPQESRLFEALAEVSPNMLLRAEAARLLERGERRLNDANQQACVVICRLRRALADAGMRLRVDSVSRAGYRLSGHVVIEDSRGCLVLAAADLRLVQRLIAFCPDRDLARLAMVRFGE